MDLNRTSLDAIFGNKNISQWADADNDGNVTKINARVALSFTLATTYIEGRLASRFIVPFDPIPELVSQLTVMRAGVELYRMPRGMVDGDQATAGIKSIDDKVENTLNQILAGQVKLIDATQPKSFPGVTPKENPHNYEATQLSGELIPREFSRWYTVVE